MNTQIIRPPAFQRPNGYIYSTATQGINNAAWTKVEFDTILANFVDGIEDLGNERILPGVAGFYFISAGVAIPDSSVVADKLFMLNVQINGVTNILETQKHSSIADYLSIGISNVVYLTKTDFVEVNFYHNTGGAINIGSATGLSGMTFLAVQRVR